jgi:hypothetical protein
MAGGPVEVPCVDCGSPDVEVSRPGWVQGLREWLRFGGPWRPSRSTCRRCGGVSGVGASTMYLTRREGWRRVPAGLAGIVRRRRTMVPVPLTYLVAAAVGGTLGAAAQVVLGWPWWRVAAAFVVAVWLFFLSTAFRGIGSSRSLATEVLLVVNPAAGVQREQRELVDRFRAAPLPLYGLPPSWSGPRYLGGLQGRGAGRGLVTTALSLGHGDPAVDQGPQLRVEVRAEQDGPEQAAADLVGKARGRPDPAWSQVAIPVDGLPASFAWLAEGRDWVAYTELEDRALVLQARDLPVDGVELVQITDLEPYIQGTRRFDEEARARHSDPHG